jgi:sugar phosphate isomerase/epimerase
MNETNTTGAVRSGRVVAARPHRLEGALGQVVAAGYTAAEIAAGSVQCILGGRLFERHIAQAADACALFANSLAYSVHYTAVDLRDGGNPDLQRELLRAHILFCAAIGARVLVLHYEKRSDDPAVEARFKRGVLWGADLAGTHHVTLGIENIEVERTERVLEFLEEVRHPNVRMTYDFGHDYLASNLYGYDYLASAQSCAPYVAHLHLTDNFGRFHPARLGDYRLYAAIPHEDRAAQGLGDLHLPIGWGTLPASEAYRFFAARGYTGLLISEHEYEIYSQADPEVRTYLQTLTALS